MEIMERIATAIMELQEEKALTLVEQALQQHVQPLEIIEQGIVPGVRAVGKMFENQQCFLPELMKGGEISRQCIALVTPHISKEASRALGRIVIGTVKGDIHSIGKNLVALLLEVNGFEVHDLGIDVPTMTFIEEAERREADIIALSALMVTTMQGQAEVIQYLREMGLRDKYRILIGGAPTTQEWAEEIGADGWAPSAHEAVAVAEKALATKGPAS